MNSVPIEQVTLVLPLLTASELEQVTSTTVPGFTGNCVVVSIVLFHSVFSPVQIGAMEIFNLSSSHMKCRKGSFVQINTEVQKI